MFLEQRAQDVFQLLGNFKRTDLGRVAQAIHHIGDTAVFQCFGNGFPAVLDQLGGIARLNAFFNHFVEAEDGAGLQHATQNGLLTHQVGFHLGDKRGFQNAGTITACCASQRLGDVPALAFRVVFAVHGDQRWYTKAANVFGAHFRARAFRRHHHHGDVLAHLHAFFNDIEAV